MLRKYIVSLDYLDKYLIVLSATSHGISIASFVTVIGTLVGIASASFAFSIIIKGIIKKLLKTTRNKKKKHNKVVVLVRSKLNSIESKISEALINNKDFMTIINEEK